MSSRSHEIEKRIDPESKKTFPRRTRRTKLDPERRRRLYDLRRIGAYIGDVWKDIGLLMTEALSARTIGLPETIDFVSQCSERARMHIAERLSKHKDLENMMSQLSSYLSSFHIRERLEDPPPLLFVAACVTFVLMITASRHSHKADKYQDRIILVGGTIGIILATVQSGNFIMELKGCLAWSIVGALGFSSLFHWALSWWPDPDIHELEKEIPLPLEDLEVHSNVEVPDAENAGVECRAGHN